jgi:hypothetical protein
MADANEGTVTGDDDASKDCCERLERMLDMLARVAVLTEAAERALEGLPYPKTKEERARFRRVDQLVTVAAEVAARALEEGETQDRYKGKIPD